MNIPPDHNNHRKEHSKNNPLEMECRRYAKEAGIRRVIATVSGGADSVALLSVLRSVRINGEPLELLAMHCNFHLRDKRRGTMPRLSF